MIITDNTDLSTLHVAAREAAEAEAMALAGADASAPLETSQNIGQEVLRKIVAEHPELEKYARHFCDPRFCFCERSTEEGQKFLTISGERILKDPNTSASVLQAETGKAAGKIASGVMSLADITIYIATAQEAGLDDVTIDNHIDRGLAAGVDRHIGYLDHPETLHVPPMGSNVTGTIKSSDADTDINVLPPLPIDQLYPEVQDVIKRMVEQYNVDPWIVFHAIFTATSAFIGANYMLYHNNRYNPGCLWMITVSESGTNKSSATSRILQPLYHIESLMEEEYDKVYKKYLRDRDKWERDLAEEKLKSKKVNREVADEVYDAEPTEPAYAHLIVSDITPERLAQDLKSNPGGLMLVHDEIAKYLKSMDKYSYGKGDTKDFLTEAYSGAKIKISRVKSRKPISSRSAWIGISGGTQPYRFHKLFDIDDVMGGFFPRFLIIYPQYYPQLKINKHKTSLQENLIFDDYISDIFDSMWGWERRQMDDPYRRIKDRGPGIIALESDAGEIVDEYLYELDGEVQVANKYLRPLHRRSLENFMRFLLCLHCLECSICHEAEPTPTINSGTAKRAIAIYRTIKVHTVHACNSILSKKIENYIPDEQFKDGFNTAITNIIKPLMKVKDGKYQLIYSDIIDDETIFDKILKALHLGKQKKNFTKQKISKILLDMGFVNFRTNKCRGLEIAAEKFDKMYRAAGGIANKSV